MSKNYMPEVAKMLGLEIGEEFNVFDEDGKKFAYGPYKITDNAIVDCEVEGSPSLLYNLLTGEYTLQKRPWRPKDHDEYWIVTTDGNAEWRYFRKGHTEHLANLNMGNCFPTEEAAEAAVPEMLEKFEEIKKGVRE
ncbi:hypothetical protein [Eubacterium limosum]|uniref:hypothetical protein n=1 Tax=Eubacterium limosum TaxID=1736 RepID=UPI00106297AF|nr:hypothetical protein [Eubacterium limosum]